MHRAEAPLEPGARAGEAQLLRAPVAGRHGRLDEPLVHELPERAVKGLLRHPERREQRPHADTWVAADEVEDPVVHAAEGAFGEDPIGLGGDRPEPEEEEGGGIGEESRRHVNHVDMSIAQVLRVNDVDLYRRPRRRRAARGGAMAIPVERTRSPRPRTKDEDLGFGKHFTDHLFRMDFEEGRGWHSARVEPYGPLEIDPAASALHYGQTIFEGMKAFPAKAGGVAVFRPRAHAARLAASARRLAMPAPPEDLFMEGVRTLLREDASFMPRAPGTSLYVRPLLFATEPFLGVRPAHAYALVVMISPVGTYFSGPQRPLRLWVEQEGARAARGGLGAAKAAANYAASLLAAEEAKARGFDQVLWLDAAERRWVEEIGTMNLFAKIGGRVVTPSLEGTILAGVTRDSVIALCRRMGLAVEERRLALEEILSAHRAGSLEELFGTGTASLALPIGELAVGEERLSLPQPAAPLSGRLRDELSAIQRGDAADAFGWLEKV